MSDLEFSDLDATDRAKLVADGVCSPRELVLAAIERIERFNPQINAVVTPLFDQALAEAESTNLPHGPFRGVPLLLKDLACHAAGVPVDGGTRFLKDRKVSEVSEVSEAHRFAPAPRDRRRWTGCGVRRSRGP